MKQLLIDYIKRGIFDDLYTPEYAIRPLLEFIPENITVWECTDFGESNITKMLKNHNCRVISTDKKENFFEYKPRENFDMIITNPPYSLKNEFLEKCFEWKKPFALLLPITALEGKKRGELFNKYSIEVLVLDGRVSFLDKKNRCWFNTSWFCHNILPEKLVFRKLEK